MACTYVHALTLTHACEQGKCYHADKPIPPHAVEQLLSLLYALLNTHTP